MKKYAKIVNEETKICEVGLSNKTDFYESIGMTEMDVEQAWDGKWYVEGYAPERPKNTIIQTTSSIADPLTQKRQVRNHYLQDSDKYMLSDFPITSADRNKWKEYRVYLRDFFNDEDEALKNDIKTFEEYFA